MRSFTNVDILIVLLLILALGIALNLQETLSMLDWLYHNLVWHLHQVARHLF